MTVYMRGSNGQLLANTFHWFCVSFGEIAQMVGWIGYYCSMSREDISGQALHGTDNCNVVIRHSSC